MNVIAVNAPTVQRGPKTVTTIGLDIAKSVFQVHGVDGQRGVVIRRQLKRRFLLAFFQKLLPCLVGIEACASLHHWSRELNALGHTVRLMPPAHVKPYVKRQKNDVADAEASASTRHGSCRWPMPATASKNGSASTTKIDPTQHSAA